MYAFGIPPELQSVTVSYSVPETVPVSVKFQYPKDKSYGELTDAVIGIEEKLSDPDPPLNMHVARHAVIPLFTIFKVLEVSGHGVLQHGRHPAGTVNVAIGIRDMWTDSPR